jgi:hypothetical protein
MNFNKHLRTGVLSMTLVTTASLRLSLATNAATAVPAGSESSAMLVSPGSPLLPAEVLDFHPTILSASNEMVWVHKSSFDSMILLLLPHEKKDKKKHESDGDEGNWDHEGGRKEAASVPITFGERDREIIRSYCSHSSSNLPPGLAKRGGQLPPGLEKQLRRNGQLPPGLQKKVDRCPKELERLLPPLPPNYARVFVGGRGLIVDAQFNIVDLIDIFK